MFYFPASLLMVIIFIDSSVFRKASASSLAQVKEKEFKAVKSSNLYCFIDKFVQI